MGVDEETYLRLNASKHAVKVPQELGGGRLAFVEALHQLHCVVSETGFVLRPLVVDNRLENPLATGVS